MPIGLCTARAANTRYVHTDFKKALGAELPLQVVLLSFKCVLMRRFLLSQGCVRISLFYYLVQLHTGMRDILMLLLITSWVM